MDVERTIRKITDNHPNISVIINNAGIQVTPTFLDNDFDFNHIDNEITIMKTG